MTVKSMKDTLKEVIGGDTPTPHNAEVKDTNEAPKVSSGDTNTGETPNSYKGVDISDVPVQDQARIKALLDKKFSEADKKIQPQMQRLSAYEKAEKKLQEMGLSPDEAIGKLEEQIKAAKVAKESTPQEKKEAVKKLDKMIEDSPAEMRESLSNLRDIILEETSVNDLKKELSELKQIVGLVSQDRTNSIVSVVRNELNELAKEYGSLVEKHQDTVIRLKLDNPGVSVKRLLKDVSDPDEYEAAVLARGSKKSNNINEKLNAITSSSPGITSSSEKIDLKKTSLKGLLSELVAR